MMNKNLSICYPCRATDVKNLVFEFYIYSGNSWVFSARYGSHLGSTLDDLENEIMRCTGLDIDFRIECKKFVELNQN